MTIRTKRIYEEKQSGDGTRILVDRMWPRGISKDKAGIDKWEKELAPSGELRKWFAHDPGKWNEFKKRYTQELKKNYELLKELKSLAEKDQITLIYAAKDQEHNNAVALKEYLDTIEL